MREFEPLSSVLILKPNIILDLTASAHDVALITRADDFTFPGPEILYVNDAFCKLPGYPVEEVIGKSPGILQGPGTDAKALNTRRLAVKEGLSRQIFRSDRAGYNR